MKITFYKFLRTVGSSIFHLFVNFLISNLAFGVYFGYDSIGAVATQLEKIRGIKTTQFSALYSAYALPNIILPLFNGVLVDKVGVMKMSILLSLLVVCGSSLVALVPWFAGMLAGRIIYGLGSESLLVCQQTILSTWFGDNAFAFGINTAFVQIASAISYIVLPPIAVKNLDLALWTAVLVNVYSLCINFVYVIVNAIYKKIWKIQAEEKYASLKEEEKPKFNCIQLFKFPVQYWCLMMQSLFISSSIYSLISFGPQILIKQYQTSEETAGSMMSLINFLVCLAPVTGLIIDRFGRHTRPLIFVTCCMVYVMCFLALAVVPVFKSLMIPTVIICIMGVTFSITESSLYASVPQLIDESILGTAYGTLGCIYNTGLFLTPMIVSAISHQTNGSTVALLIYYACNTTLAAIFGLIWYLFDRRKINYHTLPLEGVPDIENKKVELKDKTFGNEEETLRNVS